jgi:hypothetical protein
MMKRGGTRPAPQPALKTSAMPAIMAGSMEGAQLATLTS